MATVPSLTNRTEAERWAGVREMVCGRTIKDARASTFG